MRATWCERGAVLMGVMMVMGCPGPIEPVKSMPDAGVEDMSGDTGMQVEADMDAREVSNPGVPSQDLSACGDVRLSTDLSLCTASYLGGVGADTVSHVEVAPDGSIVLGGVFPGVAGFGPLNNQLGLDGDAAVVKLSEDGLLIQAWTRVGLMVSSLDVSPLDGSIVVSGEYGLMAIEPSMKAIRFQVATHAAEVLDIGLGGEVLHIAGTKVTVLSGDSGAVLASFDVPEDHISGGVMDSRHERVIVTGFAQVSGSLQQPYIRAYDFNGELVWSAWDWSAAEAQAYGSDTRGNAVTLGFDGKLYFVGEAHGGNTVFGRDPMDLSKEARLTKTDAYSDPYDLNGAAPVGFISRHDLETGELEQGTFLVTRLSSDNKGNAARPLHVAANERGQVMVGGVAACCIEDGESLTVEGSPAMPGYAGGAFIALFEGDDLSRSMWTALHGGAEVELKDVATWGKVAVVAHEHVAEEGSAVVQGQMVTHESFFAQPPGGPSDVHISVIPVD